MTTLENTNVVPNVPQATIKVVLKNTTKAEIARIFDNLRVMFEQGVFNTKRGGLALNFNEDGKLNSIHIEATKWHAGRPNITRVAMYESAVVKVAENDV